MLLGNGGTDHAGCGQRSPCLTVDMIVGRSELLQPFVCAVVGEDLFREVMDRLLLVVEREVQGAPYLSAFG